MARKPNYGFEKRKKEMERKQKQDAKLARRQEEARQRVAEENGVGTPSDGDDPSGIEGHGETFHAG